MAEQPFDVLVAGRPPLLEAVERVIIDAHRRWHAESHGTPWSKPLAYRWLHFEDADPVGRLADGAGRLGPLVDLEAAPVEEVIRLSRGLGYREGPPDAGQRR